MRSTASQYEMIREALLAGRAITPMDALREFGCFRLGARIWDLKHDGMDIVTERHELPNGKFVAKYRLRKKESNRVEGNTLWNNIKKLIGGKP